LVTIPPPSRHQLQEVDSARPGDVALTDGLPPCRAVGVDADLLQQELELAALHHDVEEIGDRECSSWGGHPLTPDSIGRDDLSGARAEELVGGVASDPLRLRLTFSVGGVFGLHHGYRRFAKLQVLNYLPGNAAEAQTM
jgi:hypothetical protein